LKKYQYYLENKQEREKKALKAFLKVYKNHRYENRVIEILNIILKNSL
jgi:spore maturation protein CgeB